MMMLKLSDFPTPTAGVSLGLSGILLFWSSLVSSSELSISLLFMGLIVSGSLLAPVIWKFCCHPGLLIADLKHPTVGSVVPTIAMTLMLLSYTIGLIYAPLGVALWCIAVIAHIIFFSLFTYYRLRNFDLNHILPSWFVPPIGIVVACLIVPSASLLPFAYALIVFGVVSYLILLPIVLYRLSVGEKIENARKPTLAILAAPASLTLAGYLSLVAVPNPMLVLLLAALALLMTVTVYLLLFHLLRLPYSPAYSAFTFPLAISATAMLKFSHWLAAQPMLDSYASYFYTISLIEAIVASVVIGYVVLHTIRFLWTTARLGVAVK
jgi:exfoliative toxin A/B